MNPWSAWLRIGSSGLVRVRIVSQAGPGFITSALTDCNPLHLHRAADALDRKHQVSFGGSFDLPWFTRLSLIGHFYSPLPQNLQLPELTNGGEIFCHRLAGCGA